MGGHQVFKHRLKLQNIHNIQKNIKYTHTHARTHIKGNVYMWLDSYMLHMFEQSTNKIKLKNYGKQCLNATKPNYCSRTNTSTDSRVCDEKTITIQQQAKEGMGRESESHAEIIIFNSPKIGKETQQSKTRIHAHCTSYE